MPTTFKKHIVRNKTSRTRIKNLNVAIFFSGRVNAYEYSQYSLLELQRKYNAKMFMSLNKEKTSPYIERFRNIFSITDEQVYFEKTNNPEWFKPYESNPRVANLYSTFYHNKMAFNLIESYMAKHNMQFDIILFYRADLLVLTKVLDLTVPKPNTIYIPNDVGLINVDPPGVNVFISYGNVNTMKIYSSIVDNLEKYDIETSHRLYHEGAVLYHLNVNRVQIHEMPYKISPNENELYDCKLNPRRHDNNDEYNA